jgi:hypothetical protein
LKKLVWVIIAHPFSQVSNLHWLFSPLYGRMDSMESKRSQSALPTLAELELLPKSVLQSLYSKILKANPPPRARIEFLRRNLAWALQTLSQGNNPITLRKRLASSASRAMNGKSGAPYKPGTRLIREWQGQVHEVTILEKGYLWSGKEYRSLTRITEEITGSRRSGPRFFGLVTGPCKRHGNV